MIAGYLAARRARKHAANLLRHAVHLKNMRGDLLCPEDLARLHSIIGRLRAAAAQKDLSGIGDANSEAEEVILQLAPKRGSAVLRENMEMLFVAVAVAMAFRSYFMQPFKIPTGSMQPTLYGVHSRMQDHPGWTDRVPCKAVKWLVTGEWYREVRVGASVSDHWPFKPVKYLLTRRWYRPLRGSAPLLGPFTSEATKPESFIFVVGPNRYDIPKDAVMRGELAVMPGQYVQEGDLLWRGVVTSGDHLFVNRVAWNFTRPSRGDVAVFSTSGIHDLIQGTHYIKRLIGLPGETVSVDPPEVLVDGRPVEVPESVGRISRREPGYEFGWTLATSPDAILRRPGDSLRIGAASYFVLGDNTVNSRDGRYWGTVPDRNLVGPAFVVYWPISKRWGLIR
ncbi:MAG: signal peptidase I [Lentisphaerae bacterium]|nr:signal peptidase I [Lentisphaerota bacterium]